ncbi:MAG: nucleotidyltransferase domain-containing protein [Nitrosomonas ureae]
MDILVDMVFGSHLYGTNSETSDRDYKGVFMPTREQILLQRVPHSINESTKKGTEKNTADDTDRERYSLHYFLHLACEGETVALDMLHAPSSFWLTTSTVWEDLVSRRTMFYTRSLNAFVGYARRQAAKYGVKGSRLSEAKQVIAFLESQPASLRIGDVWDLLPEGEHIHKTSNDVDQLYEVCGKKLTAKGYCHHYVPMLQAFADRYGDRARQAEENKGVDWKAVSHAFRAAYQVQHILVDGGYTYPLPETNYLKAVKSGRLHFANEVAPKLDSLMEKLESLSERSQLPDKVNRAYWDEWLCNVLGGDWQGPLEPKE